MLLDRDAREGETQKLALVGSVMQRAKQAAGGLKTVVGGMLKFAWVTPLLITYLQLEVASCSSAPCAALPGFVPQALVLLMWCL